jgi:hypothetical protein
MSNELTHLSSAVSPLVVRASVQPLALVRNTRDSLFLWKLGVADSEGPAGAELVPLRVPHQMLSSAMLLNNNGVFCALVDETCMDATSFAACVEGVLASWRHRLPSNLSSQEYLLDFAAELEACLGVGKQQKMRYALVGADDDNPDDNSENEQFWRALFEGDKPKEEAAIIEHEEFRAVFAWIRGKEIHLLTAGAAQVQVVTNRLQAKSLLSTHVADIAKNLAQDSVKGVVKSSMLKRFAKKNDDVSDTEHSESGEQQAKSSVFRDRTLNWRYSRESLDGSSRVTMLLSDVWSPPAVGMLMQTAAEARGYASACGAVQRLAQDEHRTMRGSVAVVDVVPQELDKPDTDDTSARQSSQASRAGRTITRVTRGVGISGAAAGVGAGIAASSSGGRAALSGGTIALIVLLIAGVIGYFILRKSPKEDDTSSVPFIEQKSSSTQSPNASIDEASVLNSAASSLPLGRTDTSSVPFSVWTSPAGKRRADKPVDESWWYRARRNALMQRVTVSSTAPLESTVATFFPISAMTLPFHVPPSKVALLQRLRVEIQSFTKGVTTASLRWQVKPQDSIMAIARLPQTVSPSTASAKLADNSTVRQGSKQLTRFPKLLKPVNLPQPYVVAFNEPIKKGSFRMKFILPGVRDSVRFVNLNVFPSILTERSLRQLSAMKLTYGTRVAIRSKLIPEADSLKGRLKIRYAFLDKNDSAKTFDAPYSENFSGLHIPAFARKVRCQLLLASNTNDPKPAEMLVWSRQIESIGFQPPDIMAENTSVEAIDSAKAYAMPDATYPTMTTNTAPERKPKGRKPVPPRDVYLLVRGIRIDYAIPIDADLSNPEKGSKPIAATSKTFDADAEASIVFEESQVTITDLDGSDASGTWKFEPATVSLLSSHLGDNDFTLKLRVMGLPPKLPSDARRLKGALTMKIVLRMLDRPSGARLTGAESVVTIPVGVVYQ